MIDLSPALRIQRTMPPEQWAGAVQGLDEANKEYLRSMYKRLRTIKRLARRSDPDTSHAAAQRVTRSGSRADHLTRVVEAVRSHPGKTSAELAQITGLERHEAARRTSDGEREGFLRKGPSRKCSVSGRAAVCWWAA